MIFIVGYSRSGTKMMNKVLTMLGMTSFIPELHFFEQLYSFDTPINERNKPLNEVEARDLCNQLVNIVKRVGDKFEDGRVVDDVMLNFKEEVNSLVNPSSIEIYRVLTKQLSAPVEVDPTPRNAYYMSEIGGELNDAKFIYMIRDPRDCILSQRDKWKNYFFNKKRYYEAFRLWVNYNPWLMSRFWRSSYQQMNQSRNNLKDRLLTINYEKVTKNPEYIIPVLEKFVGINASNKDMSFIRRSNSQKWKHGLSTYQACMVQRHLKKELSAEGYELVEYSSFVQLLSKVTTLLYALKLPLSFLANINRFGNVVSMIKRRLFGS